LYGFNTGKVQAIEDNHVNRKIKQEQHESNIQQLF
jgi:hypothetical protein